SRCGLSLGNRGSASTMSCSQAHDSTARRCERTLFAVRPGLLPCRVDASSWTQSRNSRISFLPRRSNGTAPPHRDHFRSVVEYSSRVRCAGLPERKYLVTTDSSVVGIIDLQRRRRLLSSAIPADRQRRLCLLPSREFFEPCQAAAGEPASRVVVVRTNVLDNSRLRTPSVTPSLRTAGRPRQTSIVRLVVSSICWRSYQLMQFGRSAAVVGVVLNLAIWFSLHTLFGTVTTERFGSLRLLVPELATVV